MDDIKQLLGPDFLTYNDKEIDNYIKTVYNKDIKRLLKLEANNQIVNEHCLRSIYNLGVHVEPKKHNARRNNTYVFGSTKSVDKVKRPLTAANNTVSFN